MSFAETTIAIIIAYLAFCVAASVAYARKCAQLGARGELASFVTCLLILPLMFSKIVLLQVLPDGFPAASLIFAPTIIWAVVSCTAPDPLLRLSCDRSAGQPRQTRAKQLRSRSCTAYFLAAAVSALCWTSNSVDTIPRNAVLTTVTGTVRILASEGAFLLNPSGPESEEILFNCRTRRSPGCDFRADKATAITPSSDEVWTVTFARVDGESRYFAIAIQSPQGALRTADVGWALYGRSFVLDVLTLIAAVISTIALTTFFRNPKC